MPRNLAISHLMSVAAYFMPFAIRGPEMCCRSKSDTGFNMTKQITRVWSFASDSNSNVEYQTLQYADGTTSCNCKGWTRRVAADGSRSCKHVRAVHMGTADRQCKATHSYQNNQQHQQSTKGNNTNHPLHIAKLGHRKFAI